MPVASLTYATMQWPARTCLSCAHADCLRRRRALRVPCGLCGYQIQNGECYRVVDRSPTDDVVRQVHAECDDGRARLGRVDPQVHALAALFMTDLFKSLFETPTDSPDAFTHEDVLTDRLARAMQSAIEDECRAIEEELRS
jgi:hypothetical protein